MVMATRWLVDEVTIVEIDGENIYIKQDENTIAMTPYGASADEFAYALLAAIIESGGNMPDLTRHRYLLEPTP